jgi:hypothetical protein
VSGDYRVRELWVVPGQNAYLSGASVLMIRDVVVDAVERCSYNSSWSTCGQVREPGPDGAISAPRSCGCSCGCKPPTRDAYEAGLGVGIGR